MLEIRLLNNKGIPIPTLEDVTIPSLIKGAVMPSWVVLAEYCFNDKGPFLVWKQNLDVNHMAAAEFNKEGKLNSLIVQEKKIEDKEEQETYMKYLASNCLLTRYAVPSKKGEEIFLFYIPPYRQPDISKLVKKTVRVIKGG